MLFTLRGDDAYEGPQSPISQQLAERRAQYKPGKTRFDFCHVAVFTNNLDMHGLSGPSETITIEVLGRLSSAPVREQVSGVRNCGASDAAKRVTPF